MLFSGEGGVIIALDDSQIKISFTSSDACDSCGLKIVCSPGEERARILALPNPGNLTLNQKVRVDEISNLELHLALSQFGLPMLLFLLGLLLGYYAPISSSVPRELVGFMGALMGLAISFPLAKHLIQKISDVIPEKYLRIIAVN